MFLGDVLEVTFFGTADNQEVINVLHYKIGLGAPAGFNANDQAIVDAICNVWTTSILPRLSTTYVSVACRGRTIIGHVQVLPPPVAPPPPRIDNLYQNVFGVLIFNTPGMLGPGGLAIGDALPTFTTFSTRKRTGMVGRSFRGGIHLGPIRELDTQPPGNMLTVASRADFQTAVNPLRDVIDLATAVDVDLVVFPETIFNSNMTLAGATPSALSPRVTSLIVNETVGSQVSRKRRAAAVIG